jgi:hypothetical protein
VYSVFVIDANPKGDHKMKIESVEEFLKRGGKVTKVPAQKATKEVNSNIALLKEKAAR